MPFAPLLSLLLLLLLLMLLLISCENWRGIFIASSEKIELKRRHNNNTNKCSAKINKLVTYAVAVCVCVCVCTPQMTGQLFWGLPRRASFGALRWSHATLISVSQSVSQSTCARAEHTYKDTMSSSTQLPVALECGPSAERVIVACQENSSTRETRVWHIFRQSLRWAQWPTEDSFGGLIAVLWQGRAHSFKCIRTLKTYIYFKYEPTNFSKIITQCMDLSVCGCECVCVCRVSL